MSLPIQRDNTRSKPLLSVREMAIFAMLGTLMFCSKIIMEFAPNVHLLGMFTMVFTIVYGFKGLVPVYVFVMLTGLYAGFAPWWIPYLYTWAVLWGITMLVRRMPTKIGAFVFPVICGLHGLAFGTLYAPAQAIMFGLNFKQTIAWIIAGLPWDITHCIGNLIAGLLIIPLSKLLTKLDRNSYQYRK